jgi:glucokinase
MSEVPRAMAGEPEYLVIDLGGTRARAALADRDLRISHRIEEGTELDRGPEGVVAQLTRMGRSLLDRAGGRVTCLAVSTPGPLDPKTGIVYSPPNLLGWGTLPFAAMLENALGLPTLLVNDANAAGLGEFHAGSGRGHRNLVYFTISTGIGGGVIVDGRLYEGSSGMAGELGHMTIDRHGPICNCGNVGCLEMLASGTSIARRFRQALAAGATSIVTDWLPPSRVTAREVVRGAERGDPLASAIFTDAAECIGTGVVNCIHIFNPDIVALGGGVTQAHGLFEIIHRVVEQHAMPIPRQAVRVVRAELRGDQGLIGAAAAAREHDVCQ